MSSITQPKKLSVPTLVPNITKPWSPKLLANLNGEYDFKVARLRGSYIFHAHPNTDELFYILEGTLLMKLKEEGNESTAHLEDVVVSVPSWAFRLPRRIRCANCVEVKRWGCVQCTKGSKTLSSDTGR